MWYKIYIYIQSQFCILPLFIKPTTQALPNHLNQDGQKPLLRVEPVDHDGITLSVLMSHLALSCCLISSIRSSSCCSILVSLSCSILRSSLRFNFSTTSEAMRLLNVSNVWDPGLSLKWLQIENWGDNVILTLCCLVVRLRLLLMVGPFFSFEEKLQEMRWCRGI